CMSCPQGWRSLIGKNLPVCDVNRLRCGIWNGLAIVRLEVADKLSKTVSVLSVGYRVSPGPCLLHLRLFPVLASSEDGVRDSSRISRRGYLLYFITQRFVLLSAMPHYLLEDRQPSTGAQGSMHNMYKLFVCVPSMTQSCLKVQVPDTICSKIALQGSLVLVTLNVGGNRKVIRCGLKTQPRSTSLL
ncbi:Hypothetical predicted protein, partial [Olea europaea subsp. europaea]